MKIQSSRRRLILSILTISLVVVSVLAIVDFPSWADVEAPPANVNATNVTEVQTEDPGGKDVETNKKSLPTPSRDDFRTFEFNGFRSNQTQKETEKTTPTGRRLIFSEPTTTTTTTTTNKPTVDKTQSKTQPKTTANKNTAPAVTTAPAKTSPVVTFPKGDNSPTVNTTKNTTKPTTASTAAPTTVSTTAAQGGSFHRASADEFIRLLNEYRVSKGKCSLQKSSKLTSVGESRSVEIVTNFSHEGLSKYGSYGENIFMGAGLDSYGHASIALERFKGSPSHDENQLWDEYRSVGVGHYICPKGGHYWAVVFGF